MTCSPRFQKSDRTCCRRWADQETRPVDELAAVISFLNKHLLFEYVNFYLNSHYYIEQNFKEFGRKIVQSYQQVN